MRKLSELENRVARLEKRSTKKVYPVYETSQDVGYVRHIKLIPLPKVLEAMAQDRSIDEDQIVDYMKLRKTHSLEFVAEMFVMLAETQVGVSLPFVKARQLPNTVIVDMTFWPQDEEFERWFKDWTDTYLITVHD